MLQPNDLPLVCLPLDLPPEAVTSCKRFFESFASLDGERLDRLVTIFFETDAKTPAAQATLAKFQTKPQVLVNQ